MSDRQSAVCFDISLRRARNLIVSTCAIMRRLILIDALQLARKNRVQLPGLAEKLSTMTTGPGG